MAAPSLLIRTAPLHRILNLAILAAACTVSTATWAAEVKIAPQAPDSLEITSGMKGLQFRVMRNLGAPKRAVVAGERWLSWPQLKAVTGKGDAACALYLISRDTARDPNLLPVAAESVTITNVITGFNREDDKPLPVRKDLFLYFDLPLLANSTAVQQGHIHCYAYDRQSVIRLGEVRRALGELLAIDRIGGAIKIAPIADREPQTFDR